MCFDISTYRYAISVPIEHIMNEMNDVIAYLMNNNNLPYDHGKPLRVLIPGYVDVVM